MSRGGSKRGRGQARQPQSIILRTPSPSPDPCQEGDDTQPAPTDADAAVPEPATASLELPADLGSWRALLSSLPTRDLFRLIQKDPGHSAQLFAGFRPSAGMLRHPVVLGRLAEDAQRHQAFGEALAALQPAETSLPDSEPPPAPAPVPVSQANQTDTPLQDTVKRLRNALREKDHRLEERDRQLAAVQKERDLARQEIEQVRAAARSAREEAERERRLREREARRQPPVTPESSRQPDTSPDKSRAKVAVATSVMVAGPHPLLEALQRLLNRGRYTVVAEVSREALGSESAAGSSASRGLILSLLAAALYGSGEIQAGEDHDRQAASALLDGGDISGAAETLARLFTRTAQFAPGSPVRQGDAVTLRRLLLLAEREGQAARVQEIFTRMRIGSAEAGRRLKATLALGGRKTEGLTEAAFGETGSPNPMLGPDEPLALPTADVVAATITARQVVAAVDGGDTRLVSRVHAGLAELRRRGGTEQQLAEALMEAVAAVDAVAVLPLLASTLQPVVVDASNVARHNPDPLALSPPPRVGHLLLMRDFLLRQGFFPVLLIADANLRFHVDDRAAYQRLLDRQIVREALPGTSADEVLLSEARGRQAPLISNDRFSEWGQIAQGVERHGFLIAGNRVALV